MLVLELYICRELLHITTLVTDVTILQFGRWVGWMLLGAIAEVSDVEPGEDGEDL